MKRVSIEFNDDIVKQLKKRADENYLSFTEMIEDIVRRSMVSWKGATKTRGFKVDDKLVEVFSRENRGPRKKVKKKK